MLLPIGCGEVESDLRAEWEIAQVLMGPWIGDGNEDDDDPDHLPEHTSYHRYSVDHKWMVLAHASGSSTGDNPVVWRFYGTLTGPPKKEGQRGIYFHCELKSVAAVREKLDAKLLKYGRRLVDGPFKRRAKT